MPPTFTKMLYAKNVRPFAAIQFKMVSGKPQKSSVNKNMKQNKYNSPVVQKYSELTGVKLSGENVPVDA